VFHSRFKSKSTLGFIAVITISIAGVFMTGCSAEQASKVAAPKKSPTLYKTIKVDGLDIFYREAGPKNAPTILLLHGFPTSSQMFRNVIPALSDTFHLVAPDYPGFGNSSMPPMDQFEYTFDNLAEVMDKFTQKLGTATRMRKVCGNSGSRFGPTGKTAPRRMQSRSRSS